MKLENVRRLAPTVLLRGSESDQVEAKFCFRVLTPEDSRIVRFGIFAKDPCSPYTAEDHIRSGSRKTAWISATDNFKVAAGWAIKDHSEIAVIDLSKVHTECADFRKGFSGKKGMASNWAISSRELCFKDMISADAIVTVLSAERLDEFTKEDREYYALLESVENPYKDAIFSTLRKVTELSQTRETWDNPSALVTEMRKLWTARQLVWSF